MKESMSRLEAHPPYHELVMTVHDEIVAEADENAGNLEEFFGIVATVPKWCEGLPIKVEGWEGRRYRKG